jgi:cytosine/adenosine deaminase-related metal-dependent hydrolase
MYAGVRLAIAQALHAGITTVHDWCHNVRGRGFADADLQALDETGIRARFSYGYTEHQELDQPIDVADMLRIKREWFGASNGLVTLGAALRGVTCPPEVYRREWEAAREMELPISVHADSSRLRPPLRQIETMYEEGMLGKDVQIIHANNATERGIGLLAECGSSVSLSPVSEMRIGFGFPLTAELIAAGVLVSLSIDTTMLAGNADMFGVMRMTASVANARAEDEFHLTSRDMLRLATVNGAEALGISDRVGSITPGKRADLILVDTAGMKLTPNTDAADVLVWSASPPHVEMVMVDGRLLKSKGQLTAIDPDEILQKANESARSVLAIVQSA